MFVKVSNIKKNDGSIDYKGINMNTIVSGSQHYKQDLSFCVLEVGVEVLESDDVTILTESEYLNLSNEIKAELDELPSPEKEMAALKADNEMLKLMVADLGLMVGGGL